MSRTRLIVGATGAAVGAGIAARLLSERQRRTRRRRHGDDIPFGSIRARQLTVTATDGVKLNVEIDELDDEGDVGDGQVGPTVVFAHGWMCCLDTWHFQRAALRGRARMVFYDQRSHGKSGRSRPANATIEQLAEDLHSVIEAHAAGGDIILVGHSMGGMTIMSLAADHPGLFGNRVKGVVLCATGANRLLKGSKTLIRLGPLLARISFLLDAGRSFNSYAVLRRFGLGPGACEEYVDMTEEMILKNRSHVLLDFYPMLLGLDLEDALENIAVKHVAVIGGDKDLLTPIHHSRRLADRIDGAALVALDGVGHMVMFEDHATVTGAIGEMVDALS